MKNLFKYEFRKTLVTKLVILGITAAAQLIFLYGLWQDSDNTVGAGVLLLTFTALFGILFIGLQSVLTLHKDMNTKQSYMLFMTPNSCYKILGAKMLENLLSMLIGGAFFFGLGSLDIALLLKHYDVIDQFTDAFQEIFSYFGYEFDLSAGYMASITFGMLSSWFATVTTAFLADVISSSLLNGRKLNLLVSFIIFLVLSYLTSRLGSLVAGDTVMRTTQIAQDITTSTGEVIGQRFYMVRTTDASYFLKSGAVSLALSGLFYVATAELMQRKLSV